MINVLEIIKDERTVGHKWPLQAVCCQVGHRVGPGERQTSEGISHGHLGLPSAKQQTQGVFPSGPGIQASSLPFYKWDGGKHANIGVGICVSVCACLRHTKHAPLSVSWRFFS